MSQLEQSIKFSYSLNIDQLDISILIIIYCKKNKEKKREKKEKASIMRVENLTNL